MSAIARRYFVKAVEEAKRGDLEQAREDFRAALDLAPTFVEARVSYAMALAQTGDASRAAQLLRQGLQRETRSSARVRLESALGDVLIAGSDYRGAEEAFTNASQAGQGLALAQPDLHDRLARLRAKTGRFAEAFDELLLAARQQPKP